MITNLDSNSAEVKAVRLATGEHTLTSEQLDLGWPAGIYSLSHIALPFRVDDPVYGGAPQPGASGGPMLGTLAPRGERKVLRLAPNYFLRLRYNPFFDYQERHLRNWLELQ